MSQIMEMLPFFFKIIYILPLYTLILLPGATILSVASVAQLLSWYLPFRQCPLTCFVDRQEFNSLPSVISSSLISSIISLNPLLAG